MPHRPLYCLLIRHRGVDWIHLDHIRDQWNAFVNTKMNKCVPYSVVVSSATCSFLEWGETVHFVRRPAFGLLYQPRMMGNDDEYEAVGMIDRENRNIRRKPDPVPLCPPQIPCDLSRARTRATAMGSRRLTAWVTARPSAACTDTVKSNLPEIYKWSYANFRTS
jgi:hypothetical protein